jgi:hypothetical protein
MMTILSVLFAIVFFMFPVWVAIQAWRKGFKTLAVITGVSYLIPFVPQVIGLIAIFIVKPYQPNWDFSPNPKSFAGCGTKFYGASERNGDESFITTEWFGLFYVPLLPIQSYRVIRLDSVTKNYGASITTTINYSITKKLKLYVKQIIVAYLFLISFILFASVIFLAGKAAQGINQTLFTDAIIGLLVIYAIAGYFLFRAK